MKSIVLAAFLLLAELSGASGTQMLLGVGARGVALPPGMTTPLIAGSNNNGAGAPSTTANSFFAVASGYSSPYSATYGPVGNVIGLAGTVSNLSVRLGTAVTTGSWQVGLNDGGTLTALNCTISSGQTCNYTASISLNAGDKIAWELVPSSSPAPTSQSAAPQVMISALFTANAGVNQGPILMGSNGAVTTGAAYYIGPGEPVPSASTSEITVSGLVPVAGTITAIWAISNGAVGSGSSQYYTLTAWHNGQATSPALSCQIIYPATTCNSSTNPFTVAAGDAISCVTAPSATAPTGRVMTCGFVWQPNTPGQALVFGSGRAGLPAAATDYYGVAGPSAPGSVTTEANTQQLSPTLPSGGHTLTFANLYVAQGSAPSSRATTLRAGSASVGPRCTMTSSSTGMIGGVAGTNYCSDTASGDAYSSPSGAFLDMMTSDSVAASNWFKSTMTAVYQ